MKDGGGQQSKAKGSAKESESWLNLAAELSFFPPETGVAPERRCFALITALTRRINSHSAQGRGSGVREERAPYEAELVPWFDGSMAQPAAEWEDLP
jgi:hypothetical protein